MKKICLILCCFILLNITIGITGCTMRERGADDVLFDYFFNKEDKSYWIMGSNIDEKTLEDNWEMVDVVVPVEYNGRPVTFISNDTFRECQILRSVTIPNGITSISSDAFFNCDNLTDVNISQSVQGFYGGSFANCNSLKEVTVDPENPWFCSIEGVVYTKDEKELVFYPSGKTDAEFIIPEGCSAVGRYAFAYCENLKRIIVPDSVTNFSYESIVFCKGLEGIFVDKGNQTYSSIDGNLYSKDGKTFFRLCVSDKNINLTLPEGVVEVVDGAACHCENLITINLPKSLTFIGTSAFANCDNLTTITIPKTVTYIGERAFLNCTNLTEAIFEEPSGWRLVPQRGKFQSTIDLKPSDLATRENSSEYLTKKYSSYDWKKED